MSNKNNESEPISVEKLRSSHPGISFLVNETSSKPVESTNETTQTFSNNQITLTPAKITSSPNQSITVTTSPATSISRKMNPVTNDRKIPPYINVNFKQDPVRVNKPQAKPLNKSFFEKPTMTAPSNHKGQLIGIRKTVNPQIIRQSPVNKSASVLSVEKITSNLSTGSEEVSSDSSKNSVEKIAPIPLNRTIFEKNIQSNVLTITSPTPSKMLPVKDVKANVTIESAVFNKSTSPNKTNLTIESAAFNKAPTSPNIVKTSPKAVLSTETLCKNISKSVSVQSTEAQKTIKMVSNNIPKSDIVTKPPFSKSPVISDTKTSKIMIAVTSTDSGSKITEAKVSKSISAKSVTSPSVSSGTKNIPKLTSNSTPISKFQNCTESVSIPNLSSHISNKNLTYTVTHTSGNLQLSSFSELENNKDLREALNSGSTASVGGNVTISSTGSSGEYFLINARQVNDPKIRNPSNETTIETIPKQSNSNSPVTRNKNTNPNESGGHVSQSPKSDSSINMPSPSSNDSRNCKRETANSLMSEEMDTGGEKNVKKKVDEPVECLTISSDEETEPEHFISSLSDTSDVSVSIMSKEPSIKRDEDVVNRSYLSEGSIFEKENDNLLENTNGDDYINLSCRTVRIGSYKVIPRSPVTLSQYGLRIVVPAVNNSNENVTLKISIQDIIKVLVHFNRSLPVIFYYVTAQAGAKVRSALKMTDSGNCYFDPNSEDESHRRITLLPEKFTDACKMEITDLYKGRDILDQLTHNEANQLLVRSAPKEVQKVMKQVPPNPVQTIMVFPPPPAKGGISINTEDYSCLAEDVFLNDVIIDFYLKYLFLKILSEEDRQKTHIFSSFFYKRLTDKATPVPKFLQNSKSNDNVSAAEIRHSRVKNWTKNIDIFSKDYIVIPLNENQHWFLAIICFPGLEGPVRYSDNTPIDLDNPKLNTDSKADSTNSDKDSDGPTMTIGSTTITPLRVDSTFSVGDEESEVEDRDEADGADEDINIYTSTDDSEEEYSDEEIKIKEKKKPEREPIKQPCILIFDSLAGASRARIIATLREYLHVEYKTKHKGEERDFSKNIVKGACPRVPQQNNYTDCGLYVLQYVESFFENKITDFHIPIKTLRDWFPSRIVSNKRYEIQQLLLDLMGQQNINVQSLRLPDLNLSPRQYYDFEDYDEAEYYDEDELEHAYEYEYDEISEHDARVKARCAEPDSDYSDEEVRYKYQIYDSDDSHGIEAESEEDNSDEDIMYKNLEAVDMVNERCRRTVFSVRKDENDEETIHQEEEEFDEEEEEEDEEEEEQLTFLNKQTVTISRMSGNSESSESSKNPNVLAQLKAARPWKQGNEVSLDRTSEDGCSSKKKFKSS